MDRTGPSEIESLRGDVTAFERRCLDETSRGGGRLRLMGETPEQVAAGFDRLERRTHRSVWNMQRDLLLADVVQARPLNARSRARHLSIRMVTSRRVLRQNPLIPSLAPHLRVGPVFVPLLVADEAVLVVNGPATADGEVSAWTSTDRALVAEAVALYERTWALSRPVAEHVEGDLLTERQVEVALQLGHGHPDATIARRLGVSPRTVATEVRVVLDHLGVGSRTAAAALLANGLMPRDLPPPSGME